MEVGTVVQEELNVRGVEFAIKVELRDRLLTVEISDVMTADQWSGEFDPACKCALLSIPFGLNMSCLDFFSRFACCFVSDIEDLTRKTGNFKQFPIFCSMLESAVSKVTCRVLLLLFMY